MPENEDVYPGGLMRCCTATLADVRGKDIERPKEGDIVECRYCDNRMIFRDGAWRWKSDDYGKV